MKWIVLLIAVSLACCKSQKSRNVSLTDSLSVSSQYQHIYAQNIDLESFINALRSDSIVADDVCVSFESRRDDVAVNVSAKRIVRKNSLFVSDHNLLGLQDSSVVSEADSLGFIANAVLEEESKPPDYRLILLLILSCVFFMLMVFNRGS